MIPVLIVAAFLGIGPRVSAHREVVRAMRETGWQCGQVDFGWRWLPPPEADEVRRDHHWWGDHTTVCVPAGVDLHARLTALTAEAQRTVAEVNGW